MRAGPGGEARTGQATLARSPERSMAPPRFLVHTLPLLLAACEQQGGSDDRAQYLAGLEATDPLQGLEHCRAIADPALRGDCVTALQPAMAARPGLDPATPCREIDDPTWRDECFFGAAEQAGAAGARARAAELCREAGVFSRDCANHLWQEELRAAIHPGGLRTLVEHHEQVSAIHDRWREAFGEDESFAGQFWEHCYQVAFERAEQLEPALCERVPEPATCLEAARTTYRARLHEALRAPGAKGLLCGFRDEPLLPSTRLATQHAPPDHPALIEELRQLHQSRCPQGPPWQAGP